MPPPGQPAEDFVQVNFRAAGVRVLAVVPVDQQDPHSAPYSRATASSTPFTNAGALAPANQWARAKARSEEHTSELQSQSNLVCPLLLENKHVICPPIEQPLSQTI